MNEQKLSNLLDQKMKEYISVIQSNDPHEKSRLIAELQKNHAVMINRLDNQDIVLQEIRTHVEKTNGRVNKLENEDFTNKGWIKGIGVAGSIIVLLITSIFSIVVKQINADIKQNSDLIKTLQ